MMINPINMDFHRKHNFREQLAVLYSDGLYLGCNKFLRSFISVGDQSVSGFLDDYNSSEAWARADNLIENEGVCGIFHTHPAGVNFFSSLDLYTMVAFAKTYGEKHLYYGVQSLGNNISYWMCLNMVDHRVFRYYLGEVESSISNNVLFVPCPVTISVTDRVFDVSHNNLY